MIVGNRYEAHVDDAMYGENVNDYICGCLIRLIEGWRRVSLCGVTNKGGILLWFY